MTVFGQGTDPTALDVTEQDPEPMFAMGVAAATVLPRLLETFTNSKFDGVPDAFPVGETDATCD
jgi:hypothetical protein